MWFNFNKWLTERHRPYFERQMDARTLNILTLIGEASTDEQVSGLMEIVIHEASCAEIANVREFLEAQVISGKDSRTQYNYMKAIELLD